MSNRFFWFFLRLKYCFVLLFSNVGVLYLEFPLKVTRFPDFVLDCIGYRDLVIKIFWKFICISYCLASCTIKCVYVDWAANYKMLLNVSSAITYIWVNLLDFICDLDKSVFYFFIFDWVNGQICFCKLSWYCSLKFKNLVQE